MAFTYHNQDLIDGLFQYVDTEIFEDPISALRVSWKYKMKIYR